MVAVGGGLSVLTKDLERLNHIFKGVILFGSACDQRNQTVLVKTACLLRVNVFLHFCYLTLGGVKVEATHDGAQVVGGHVAVRILVEQRKNFSDLSNHHFIQNFRFLCLTLCHFKLITTSFQITTDTRA